MKSLCDAKTSSRCSCAPATECFHNKTDINSILLGCSLQRFHTFFCCLQSIGIESFKGDTKVFKQTIWLAWHRKCFFFFFFVLKHYFNIIFLSVMVAGVSPCCVSVVRDYFMYMCFHLSGNGYGSWTVLCIYIIIYNNGCQLLAIQRRIFRQPFKLTFSKKKKKDFQLI